MGYAIFANRKIALTNQINMMQIELDDIMNQKQHLLNFSANIASGLPSAEDVCADISNINDYVAYKNDVDNYIDNNYSYVDSQGNLITVIDEQTGQALADWRQQNSDFNTYVMNALPADAGYIDVTDPNDPTKTIKQFDQTAFDNAVEAKLLEWSNTQPDTPDNEVKYNAYKNFADLEARYVEQQRSKAYNNLSQEFYEKSASKRIAYLENSLELRQKRIETKLTALKTDLQSVEQAEGQAIQSAIPKYTGVA